MVTFTCPWCDEDGSVALAELWEPDLSYDCAACGTVISFETEGTDSLDLAA